jgi:hypothetical protein
MNLRCMVEASNSCKYNRRFHKKKKKKKMMMMKIKSGVIEDLLVTGTAFKQIW